MVVKLMVAVCEQGAKFQRDAESSQACLSEAARFWNLGSLFAASDAIWISKELLTTPSSLKAQHT